MRRRWTRPCSPTLLDVYVHNPLSVKHFHGVLFKTRLGLSGSLRLRLGLVRGCQFKPDRAIRVLYRWARQSVDARPTRPPARRCPWRAVWCPWRLRSRQGELG